MGTNQDEGTMFVALSPLVESELHLPLTDKSLGVIAKHLVLYHDNWNETTRSEIVNAYPSSHYQSASYRFSDVVTDAVFTCGIRQAARAFTDQGIDVYLYHNEYKSSLYLDPNSLQCRLSNMASCGVYHGAELPLVFNNLLISPKDNKMSHAWGKYWTNFAKTGTPNSEDVEAKWPKYDRENDQHLKFTVPIHSGSGLKGPICDFWDSLPPQGPYQS